MLKTLEKEQAREFVRQYVSGHLEALLESQIDNAMDIRHVMMRDPNTGKFERVTGDAKQIDKALKTKTAFWIYTKDPNVRAFADLMNRALDKPSEPVEIAGGGSITIQWQTRDDDEKESGEVRELSSDVDDKIRRARKVNGHVEDDSSGESR